MQPAGRGNCQWVVYFGYYIILFCFPYTYAYLSSSSREMVSQFVHISIWCKKKSITYSFTQYRYRNLVALVSRLNSFAQEASNWLTKHLYIAQMLSFLKIEQPPTDAASTVTACSSSLGSWFHNITEILVFGNFLMVHGSFCPIAM